MRHFLFPLALAFGLLACQENAPQTSSSAQQIVDRAIEVHGSSMLDSAAVAFDFRDRHYRASRQGGRFQYERLFAQDSQQVRDILTNEGLIREIDGQRASIPDTLAAKYANSVNSVIYFAYLPFNLNDPAVIKEDLGPDTVMGKVYDRVGITFEQEGGGKDYEDEFVYWFDREAGTLDYLAYSYRTEGGGVRFRVARNARRVGGVLWLDYENYKAQLGQYELTGLAKKWEAGKLKLLSKIELANLSLEIKQPSN